MNDATTIGADIAKNSFYIVELDAHGKRVQRKRFNRRQFIEFFANRPACRIAMEACSGAHHFARTLQASGHQVQLLPAQHVKAYARGQKNDYNDAEAIAEAAMQGRIREVAIKTLEEQDIQALVSERRFLDKQITAQINFLRGLVLEYGLTIPQGKLAFMRTVPDLLEDAANGLTDKARDVLARHWRQLQVLQADMAELDKQLDQLAKTQDSCSRLMQVPGIGPRNAVLLFLHLGDGSRFKRGREAAAAVGVVPRQHSTGGKVWLGGITKSGDPYLRSRLVQGARSVIQHVGEKSDPLSCWIRRLLVRVGFHKTVVALVNKIIRIAWAVVRHSVDYDPKMANASA